MTETASQALAEAAAPAFVNGDATHRPEESRRAPRGPKAAAPRPSARPAAAEVGGVEEACSAFVAGWATALRLHEAWCDGLAAAARLQLDYLADAARDLVAASHDITAEPDPGQRLELACAHTLRQIERSIDRSTRLVEILGDAAGGGVRDGAQVPYRRAG
jgi:hypothetical protein